MLTLILISPGSLVEDVTLVSSHTNSKSCDLLVAGDRVWLQVYACMTRVDTLHQLDLWSRVRPPRAPIIVALGAYACTCISFRTRILSFFKFFQRKRDPRVSGIPHTFVIMAVFPNMLVGLPRRLIVEMPPRDYRSWLGSDRAKQRYAYGVRSWRASCPLPH